MVHLPAQFMPEGIRHRCYIFFSHEGKTHKLYDGSTLGVDCYPNGEKTIEGRKRELDRLLLATSTALKNGWHPGQDTVKPLPASVAKPVEPTGKTKPDKPTAVAAIIEQQEQFDSQSWSAPYIRDMNRLANELVVYLRSNGLSQVALEKIAPKVLADFLDNYRSSGRYYMNKRRNLSALFARFVVAQDLLVNPVPRTPTAKTDETEGLNEVFTSEQLTVVLTHLHKHHPNLYLCAIMTYGTLLRPHSEIRLLQRKNFDTTLDLLAFGAIKSGRIRRVPVPDYVKEQLIQRGVLDMAPETYIFTGTASPVNADYFKTAWNRQKRLMLDAGTILPNQTLYSFRHSGAVDSFTDHQNLLLLQQLMGHSTPDSTVKYIRSLGSLDLKIEDMPRLPGS